MITADLVVRTLATIGVDLALESVAKYLPIAGAVVASVISYQLFRRIADAHIEECVKVVEAMLSEPVADDATTAPPC